MSFSFELFYPMENAIYSSTKLSSEAAATELVVEGFVADLSLASETQLQDDLVSQRIRSGLLRSIRVYAHDGRNLFPAYTKAVRTCMNNGLDMNTALSWANELFRTLNVPEERLAERHSKMKAKLEGAEQQRTESGTDRVRLLGCFITMNIAPYIRL